MKYYYILTRFPIGLPEGQQMCMFAEEQCNYVSVILRRILSLYALLWCDRLAERLRARERQTVRRPPFA